MAHHDDHHNHGNENKPVAFTVPLILGAVTVLIILLFVSLGDPCHGHNECACKENCSKECMEACEKGDHSKHPADMKHEEEGHHPAEATMGGNEHSTEAAAPATGDSTKTEAAPAEHHEEAHH